MGSYTAGVFRYMFVEWMTNSGFLQNPIVCLLPFQFQFYTFILHTTRGPRTLFCALEDESIY